MDSPRKGRKKERWLLTRKTWRYMTDAGRRLIPEGLSPSSKPEEVFAHVEEHFQEVCNKENRFLLWRRTKKKKDEREISSEDHLEDEYDDDEEDEEEECDQLKKHVAVQTEPLPDEFYMWVERRQQEEEKKKGCPTPESGYSSSVSDTIKRYLRMVRKNSKSDKEKADRFKTVNYDRSLRYIKSKRVPVEGEEELVPVPVPPPELGVQAGDPLVPFLRDFNYDTNLFRVCRKDSKATSDWSSSEEKASTTSPRYSITVSDEYGTRDYFSPSSDNETDGARYSQMSSARSSIDTNYTGEDDVFRPSSALLLHPRSSITSTHSQQLFLSQQYNTGRGTSRRRPPSNLHVGMTHGACVSFAPSTVMQKSKSSSNVVHHGGKIMAKKMWRSRSKSQSRASANSTCTWTPQGRCRWSSITSRQVSLTDTTLLHLTDIERRTLQKVALAKLQALNLGAAIRIPSENSNPTHKPKRRPYLLKKKALTTGFFEGKDKESCGGMVFGISLNQCISNDQVARRARGISPCHRHGSDDTDLHKKAHHGSRTSFGSLLDSLRNDKTGSCESLNLEKKRCSLAGSLGGLDNLSCSSADGVDPPATEVPNSSPSPLVPGIVNACLRHLEKHGLQTLGIFRVSSSKKRVRQLREEFDSGKDILLTEDHCPHDIATLLKEFFRDLPEPLLCRELYPAFLQMQKIRNRKLQFEALQYLVQLLPAHNRDTLWSLLTFLATVAENATDHRNKAGEWVPGNKMDSNNLATLFAPNILHCIKPGSDKELSAERAEERIDVINVVRSMIDHNKELFEVSAELMDEVYLHLMDTHPESLDQILRKRCSQGEEILDDLDTSSSVFEGSEASSLPRTPTDVALHESAVANSTAAIDRHLERSGSKPDVISNTTEDHNRRYRKREEILHETGGTGGSARMRDRGRDRTRRKERGSTGSIGDHPEASDRYRKSYSDKEDAGSSSTTPVAEEDERTKWFRRPSGESSDGWEAHRKRERREGQSDSDAIRPLVLRDGELRKQPGVITASLKIPVPMQATSTTIAAPASLPSPAPPFALSLDDTDIPFIEDTGERCDDVVAEFRVGSAPARASLELHQRRRSGTGSSSTDSSMVVAVRTGTSSGTSTPASACSSPPWRSESSTPALSPPTSPTTRFPYEEMTARISIPTRSEDTDRISPTITAYRSGATTGTDRRALQQGRETLGACVLAGGGVVRSRTTDIGGLARAQHQQEAPMMKKTTKNKSYVGGNRHQTAHLPDVRGRIKGDEEQGHQVRQRPQGAMWKRQEIIASHPKQSETFV